jgi:hypothetical protein
MKQNVDAVPYSYFWFLGKVVSLKVARHLKICQHTKLHGLMLTGASFVSMSFA